MQFIKKFFSTQNTIIGLCGLKKQPEYLKINIPECYKKTFVINTDKNYLSF